MNVVPAFAGTTLAQLFCNQSSNIGGGTKPPNSALDQFGQSERCAVLKQGPTICTPTGRPAGDSQAESRSRAGRARSRYRARQLIRIDVILAVDRNAALLLFQRMVVRIGRRA